jgi:hypothetical protein
LGRQPLSRVLDPPFNPTVTIDNALEGGVNNGNTLRERNLRGRRGREKN